MSKYNAKQTEVDGINFSSILESEYYLLLKEKQENGEIRAFNLQPSFTLQDKFKMDGKTVRAIKYVADFEVLNNDETIEIVDVKGFVTATAKLKFKMFHNLYPHLKLTLITYVKKHGGWITLEDLEAKRKIEREKG